MNKLKYLILSSVCISTFVGGNVAAQDVIEIQPLFEYPTAPEELNSLDNIQVYYLKKKSNLESLTKSSTFLVQADSSFQIPKNSKILSKKEPFYLIETKELNSIESDPTVFSVTKIPLLQIKNICGISRIGVTTLDIIECLKTLGFKSVAVSISISELQRMPLPAILR